jgi:hypothetical protein
MALRTLALACVFSAVAADVTPWRKLDQGYTFENYEQEFARSYSQQSERNERKTIFELNLQEIIAHNSDPSNTWRRGLSDFTDRTQEEIRTLIPRGFDKQISLTEKRRSSKASPSLRTSTAGLPDRVDWREHTPPIITPVKNQGTDAVSVMFPPTPTDAFLSQANVEAAGPLPQPKRLNLMLQRPVADWRSSASSSFWIAHQTWTRAVVPGDAWEEPQSWRTTS